MRQLDIVFVNTNSSRFFWIASVSTWFLIAVHIFGHHPDICHPKYIKPVAPFCNPIYDPLVHDTKEGFK